MAKKIVKFTDSELGDSLWNISFDAQKYNFDDCFKLAMMVMYLPFYEEFDDLKENYPELTREHYNIAFDILEDGENGVTDDRFCDFLSKAFDFACEEIKADLDFNVESGEFE